MTIDDLIQWLGNNPLILGLTLCVAPICALVLGKIHAPKNGGAAPWKFLYTLLVYGACVPGMFASVLTGYQLFFRNENFLKLNLLVYVLPILSMIICLLLIRRGVNSFDEIPGFGRLSGLMLLLGLSFAAAFALHRLTVGIFFVAPLAQLGVIAVAVFALLHWGMNKLGGKEEKRSLTDVIKGEQGN